MAETGLRAGAAQVDITPERGTQIAGGIGRYRPVEEVLDPLYAKALVLEAVGKRLCLVALDLTIVTRRWADEIRDRARDLFGFDPGDVMVHVTQNHSAPALGHFFCGDDRDIIPPEMAWLRGGDDRYHPFAVDKSLEAIGEAIGRLQSATIGAASEIDGRAAANRRYIMRDGSVVMNPRNRLDVLCAEGPIDPEVGVVAIRTVAGDPLAMLLHHTCHPTNGYPGNQVTADWPGAWSRGMVRAHGPGWLPIVLNGCCGNIAPNNRLDSTWGKDQERIGRVLTESAGRALERIEYRDVPRLDARSRYLRIPMRPSVPEQIDEARRMLEAHPTPPEVEPGIYSRDWVYAVSRLDHARDYERQPWFDYEIQVFRIGEIALVALPGEPFVEGQIQIKLRSPVRYTYIAHMSNSCGGYIPTRRAFAGGGYESSAPGQKLIEEALSTIADQTVGLLDEVFADIAPARPPPPAIEPPL